MTRLAVLMCSALVFVGCANNQAGCAQKQQDVEMYGMGQGFVTPPDDYLYVGDKDEYIVYFPDCPLVADIPSDDLRYYTEVPPWHRLDEDCRAEVDPCEGVACELGFHCEEGDCIPDDRCCWQFVNGTWLPLTPCWIEDEDGICRPEDACCWENDDGVYVYIAVSCCTNGYVCVDGACVNPCEGVDCGIGWVCEHGNCVPEHYVDPGWMESESTGWGDVDSAVQKPFPIHPKDLDADGDVDSDDLNIAQSVGGWNIPMVWENWPEITLNIKSNFRYNPKSSTRIDNAQSANIVTIRAYALELPFGWIWDGRVLLNGRYVFRNSLMYKGRVYETKHEATTYYNATKAQNWANPGDMSSLPRPDVGTNGLETTAKELFRYGVWSDWDVTFSGTDARGGDWTDQEITGVSLSRNGWELFVNEGGNNNVDIPVFYNTTVTIRLKTEGG